MLIPVFMAMLFYLRGIFGILPFIIQDCLPHGSIDFTTSAVLQSICGSTLQLHALRLASAVNSTLAKSRKYVKFFDTRDRYGCFVERQSYAR
jgi:hypothetical protein